MADETILKGNVRILYIKVATTWIPVSCLTDNPFREESEMLSTTTSEDGGWGTSVPTNQNYGIDFTGLQMLTTGAGDTTKMSYDRLKVLKKARTKIEWKIEDDNAKLIDYGFGFIKSLGETNDVGGFLEFDGSIVGFGEPLFDSEVGIYIFQDGDNFLFQDGNAFIFQ